MGNLKKDSSCLNLKWVIMRNQTYIIGKIKAAWELSNFAAKKGLQHATFNWCNCQKRVCCFKSSK